MNKWLYRWLTGVVIGTLVLVALPVHAQEDGATPNACEGDAGEQACLKNIQDAYLNFEKLDNYTVSFNQTSEQRISSGEGLMAIIIDQTVDQTIEGVIRVGDGEVLVSQPQAAVGNGETEVLSFTLTPETPFTEGTYLAEVMVGDNVNRQEFNIVASNGQPSTDNRVLVVEVGTGTRPEGLQPTSYFGDTSPVTVAVVLYNNSVAGDVVVHIVDTDDSRMSLNHTVDIRLGLDTQPTSSTLEAELLQVNNAVYIRGRQSAGEIPYVITPDWQNISDNPQRFPGYMVLDSRALREFNYAPLLENANVDSIIQTSGDPLSELPTEAVFEVTFNPLTLAGDLNFTELFAEGEQEKATEILDAIMNNGSPTIKQTITLQLVPNLFADNPTNPYVVSGVVTEISFNVELSENITGDAPINLRQRVTTTVGISEFNTSDVLILAPQFTFGR